MASAGIGAELEGIHAVGAALEAGRVTRITVERGRRGAEVERIVATAEAAGIPVVRVDDVRPLAATEAPQGLVAEARPIALTSLEDAVHCTDPASLLVLDHLEDPRNVGAVARSAVAAGIGALVYSTRRSAPLGATAFKAAAGALERIAVVEVNSIADTVARLSKLGVWTVGLDGDAETPLFGHPLFVEPVAIVVGAEGAGLSRLVSERLDVAVRIPMTAGSDSLNASVAASLAVFELARVRGWVT